MSDLPPRAEVGAAPFAVALSSTNTDVVATVSAMASFDLHFGDVSGQLRFSRGEPTRSQVDLEVVLASATSSPAKVAEIATSDRFLDAATYPLARFASRRIQALPDGTFELLGTLALHGVERALVVPVALSHDACGLEVRVAFAIDRRAFGVESDSAIDGLVADDVDLSIVVRAPWPDPPVGCRRSP